ncbi:MULTISPECIES: calcium-translocating P-type ATPase, SERCA-type [Virgibacillus]|uniref:ATPase n=1 Tax=Virgibacillus pantothenticus TaxID=1473 RepID=A0A0L0QNC7_VIRPA|nr:MULTISPECIES: calcium-translocating P-type ATPase, SERCA-type [Virgibacillus]API93827.1 calcium-translocating P-type ATPase, SERCA-type [Virgibacillus sp. 6R]KNE20112.1 ATPase [Virgibacillus pantothenticus]MBS7427628.1 calcium-translocating P-type ATPase, SERCA-type [Virgibacillus sp. 19R1-5]MED3737854.1 calcium-translocating P-type ATPase, SERCA-type [Virgibacillus pantothenticus]QTY18136.1 calcium-translocating P-type ATPase, SERCA-type [Virgibacillus pantothenticus]
MKWYQLEVEDVEKQLHVTTNRGLSDKQVEKRRKQYGENALQAQKKASKWLIFLKQFQDFMVLVLLAATLVAGLLGEYIDAIAIMVIVLVNGCIGFFQEQKAEKSLDKLKELSAPMAYVLRNKKWERIPSRQVVVGDIVRISSGDRIPADIRIVRADSLETEESALTGESLPVSKHTQAIQRAALDAQDQVNMGFMGTLVTRGTGMGIVVGTGMQTVMGQIASLMANTKKVMTPLERKLAELGKILIVIALLLTALVVVLGVVQGQPVYTMFLAGVSLAVAAIPEGLPAIVTVALSLGVQRMIRKKAIVRKLSAVETLGCASVICSDKTGTMTENKMTVKELLINGKQLYVTGDGYELQGNFFLHDQKVENSYPHLRTMLLYGLLCNHSSLVKKKGKYVIDGNPTDGALLIAARKFGLSDEEKEAYRIIKEFPFDSDRKRMSVIVEDKQQRRFLITKGAPDILLPRSTYMLDEEGKQLLKAKNQATIEQEINQMADKALRTLAIAVKPINKDDHIESPALEKDLTFIGVYGMMDPPRKEVKKAVQECRSAGIKTVMITGDHAKTARAIALNLELMPEDGNVLEGYQMNKMSQQELEAVIEDVYVFARVTPEHKLRIVHAFQEKGHVVAMTGDGVNDAPAIKASNIGISMGQSGTDVTKEASSLILMDDNFATIKAAIEEGRNIYENIRKFIRYLLASNVGEILVMLFAMLLSLPLPLVPVQILWVNLVTDGLPAMALGMDKAEGDVMKKRPRSIHEGVFARGLGYKIISRGIVIGIVTLIGFIITYQNDPEHLVYAQTIAFTTLVMAQLIHVFDCRSEHSIFARNPFENIYLVLAVLSSLLLLLVVIYWQPLQPIFHTVSLSLRDWMLVLALSAIPTVLFGFTKK